MALKDVRILIVDDELFFRQVLRDTLEKIGFTVVAEAADGDEAVAGFKSHRPNVTIMDIYMPNKNGIEATREILALDPRAKVLVCCASGFDYDTQAALDVGATARINKPFAAREIYDAVRLALTGK